MATDAPIPAKNPVALLVCQASAAIGLGHLTRILVVAHALRLEGQVQPYVVVIGEPFERDTLCELPHSFVPPSDDVSSALLLQAASNRANVVVFDIHPTLITSHFIALLGVLRTQGVRSVGIDSLLPFCSELDLAWVPTFCLPEEKVPAQCNNVRFGWDTYLLRKMLQTPRWRSGSRVLVLTGGGDTTHQGESLPGLMDAALDAATEVHWVQGPFALAPRLPLKQRLHWTVHKAPQGLDELMVSCSYAVALFGISFFELLQYGVPTVVFSPYGGKDDFELTALRSEGVASVASDASDAVNQLVALMQDDHLASRFSTRCTQLFSVNGAQSLAAGILELSRS